MNENKKYKIIMVWKVICQSGEKELDLEIGKTYSGVFILAKRKELKWEKQK